MELLELLIYLEYDFLLESQLLENNLRTDLLKKIRGKDEKYIEKLKKVLKEDFSILKTEKNRLSLFLYIFDYFYKIGYSKITSKKIKQYIDSGSYMLFPNNIHLEPYLKKLTFVHKGNPLLEKIEGIKLYQDYRFRILSSIPDISGKIDEISYQMVDLHDPNIISNGIEEYSFPNNQFASSCLTPNGKAASCLFYGALNPNGRFFKVTYQDKIIAYSWVWRCGDILCFDNIEVTKELYKMDQFEELIANIYLEASKKLINITTKQENRGIQLVILGKNKIDIIIPTLLKLPQVNQNTEQLYHPNSPENLYLKDSSEIQIILAGEYHHDLKTEDIEPQYLYSRKPIYQFREIKNDILLTRLNAIYFDYCLDNNISYHKILEDTYIDGFGNEDWFIGLKKDKTKDFFYCGKDKRLFQEAEKYDHMLVKKNSFVPNKIIIPKSKIDQINFLLDSKNYISEIKKVQEYLKEEMQEKFILSNQDYSHKTKDLLTFSKILLEGKITSAEYGNRETMRGKNGKNYISIAKIGSKIYHDILGSKAFILSDDMCTFPAFHEYQLNEHSHFTDTTYPLRPNAFEGEYQVLNFISLDKAKGILVSKEEPMEIAQIIYLQELLENQLPLILLENNQIIDKDNIKKYIKLK